MHRPSEISFMWYFQNSRLDKPKGRHKLSENTEVMSCKVVGGHAARKKPG